MDGDRKTGALKQLQGHMWHEAYNSGTIKAQWVSDSFFSLEFTTKTLSGSKIQYLKLVHVKNVIMIYVIMKYDTFSIVCL